MADSLDADGGDRCAGDGRDQGAPKRVAERVAEARLERLDGEATATVADLLDGDLGALNNEQA